MFDCRLFRMTRQSPVMRLPLILVVLTTGSAAVGNFVCDEQRQTIPQSYVNDNYCDCQDGSDEPRTAACSNGRFLCANKKYKSLHVFSSHVNDGVCDCCDGSDEYDGKVNCDDTCEGLANAVLARKKVLFETFKAGARFRNETVEQAEVR
jgi:protein kinase C substrate 80K-H